jgi:hypothetical protein
LSTTSPKTFADVRAAFENRTVLRASRRELEELLAASVCLTNAETADRMQAHDMCEALAQLIANRRSERLRRPSRAAVFALLLIAAALLWCGAQVYHAHFVIPASTAESVPADEQTALAMNAAAPADLAQIDRHAFLTIDELAARAPTLQTGTAQAWWMGQQAREVQRLEAQAKRQAIAGDYQGAARSATRAYQIRSTIPAVASSEHPSAH